MGSYRSVSMGGLDDISWVQLWSSLKKIKTAGVNENGVSMVTVMKDAGHLPLCLILSAP